METNTLTFRFIKLVTLPKYIVYVNKQKQLAIGYNHTIGVHKCTSCTKEQAELWLKEDINYIKNMLYRAFPHQLSVYQTAALISLIHEITVDVFRSSQLYIYLINKQYKLASQEFKKYDMKNTSVLRRTQEQNLFNYKGVSHEL